MPKNITVKTTTPKDAMSQVRGQQTCQSWNKATVGTPVIQVAMTGTNPTK